jgi:nicotinamidase-related amidase
MNEHTLHVCAKIEKAQWQFDRVVVTRYFQREDSLIRDLLSVRGFERGSPETQLAFVPRPDAFAFEKSTYSCVTPELVERLRGWDVDAAFVCGVDTDQCVLVAAADLLQHDIRPVVCANMTASAAGPAYHEAALTLLRRLIGDEQVRPFSARAADTRLQTERRSGQNQLRQQQSGYQLDRGNNGVRT